MYNQYAPDVNTIESVVSGRRVFVGNQPDDFALAGWLAPGDRISLIGLGYGGALRPILATAPQARLIGVENDQTRARECKHYFTQYFPCVRVQVANTDARRYIRDCTHDVDALCVDVYDDAGYPDFVFEPDFWSSAFDALSRRGVLLVNCWGLPWQLNPWRPPSPLPNLVYAISTSFPAMRYVKNRRNVTIVASEAPLARLPQRAVTTSTSLNRQDRIVAECLAIRWASSDAVPHLTSAELGKPLRLRTDINMEMARRWRFLPAALGSTRTDRLAPRQCESVQGFLSSPATASEVTLELLERGAVEADLLPIAAAAGHFEGRTDTSDWYGPWLLENFSVISSIDQDWLWSVALWQALCLIAYPFSIQPHWTDDLLTFCENVIPSYCKGAVSEDLVRHSG
jgi:hypothetical protein